MISCHCISLCDGAKWFGVHSPVRVYIALCLLRSHFLQQQNTLCCSVCSFLPSLLLVLSTIAPTLCLCSHECFQPPRVVFFVSSLSPIGQDEKHWASIVLQLNDEVSNALSEFLKSKAFRGYSTFISHIVWKAWWAAKFVCFSCKCWYLFHSWH